MTPAAPAVQDPAAALPPTRLDWIPLALVPALALAALPFISSGSTWITLTVAGLAMGTMIFIMASGLTLVFGLMDVMNFAHGAFIAVGAYAAASVLGAMRARCRLPASRPTSRRWGWPWARRSRSPARSACSSSVW